MTRIDTRKMAAKGLRIGNLIGRTATADGHTGVIVSLRDHFYPRIQIADGQIYSAGAVVTLIEA